MLAVRSLTATLAHEECGEAGLGSAVAAFGGLLRDGEFMALALTVGFSSGAFLSYVAGSPFALEDVYHASPQLFGVLFGCTGATVIASAPLNAHLLESWPVARLSAV